MTLINLAHYNPCTGVEGPGLRFALWCQGCLRHCPGCCNPHMHEIMPVLEMQCNQILQMIADAVAQHHIEGITFLGGEPFLQAEALFPMALECRRMGLTTAAFTGYTLEELGTLPFSREFLNGLDLLIDGPYIRSEPERKRNWAGSRNQRFHYLTTAYNDSIECCPDNDGIDITIDRQGRLIINGSAGSLHDLLVTLNQPLNDEK